MIITGTRVRGGKYYGGTASAVTTDTYFNLVTLLLPGNGTNGAQNNTFLDSSTNAFTVTRNGNTTQGTFSPFSQTGWSNYFDGSGDNLSVADNAAFEFGSGSFTIELWFNLGASGTNALVTKNRSGTGADGGLGIDVSTTTIRVYIDGNAGTTLVSNVSTTISLNTWYHLAVVRSVSGGTNNYIFLNGVQVGTSTTSTAFADNGQPLRIGTDNLSGANYNQLTGYISNLRIVKGTAVYTSAFTPSTTPLTAISGTSLLTCQSNRFVDNSSNAFAITVNGNTSVQAFSPLDPSTAYSTSTVGGSGYFDGSGDSLTYTSTVATGSGDFTLEVWVYLLATPSINGWVYGYRSGNNISGYLFISNTNLPVFAGDTTTYLTSNTALTLNSWNHIAVVRQGLASGNLKMYLNGIEVASVGTSNNFSYTGTQYIGATNGGNPYNINGYISNLRIVPGTAVYTAAFTPPTAPLTAISGTSLLLNYTNGGITDATAKNVIETVGNASISTTQSKFGGSSLFFDGNADALLAPSIPINALGTEDFTIEAWIRWSSVPNSGANYAYFFAIGGNNVNGMGLYVQNGKIKLWNTAEVLAGSTTLSTNTWYHVALVRSSGTVKLYLNGTQDGTVSMSSNLTGGVVNLGYWYNISDLNYFSGYMDDFRITRGYARYTANFTPPTQAFPTQ